MIYLGIVGSRDYTDYKTFSECINNWQKNNGTINVIVTGDCRGTDKLVRKYAIEHNIELIVHQADWKKYGKSAGPKRNTLIINELSLHNNSHLIAFPLKSSIGTWDSVKKAKEKNIDTQIIKEYSLLF